MFEGLLTLFTPRPWADMLRDAVDVLVVAYAIYRILLLLRGTRAMQVGQGLALVGVVYLLAQRLGLLSVYALLDRFLASFLLVFVVIFQTDIRRALMRVGNRPFLFWRWRKSEESSAVEEAVLAAVLLAHKRVGALIVFERDASLDDFISQGTVLDAEVTRELIYAAFLPQMENPLHDGALVIRNARIWKAGGFLPLTNSPGLDRALGTRHRAALGISEETDAVVLVVSEERGEISLCFNGNIVRSLNPQTLRTALYGMFYTRRQAAALIRDAATSAAEMRPSRMSIPPPPAADTRAASQDSARKGET